MTDPQIKPVRLFIHKGRGAASNDNSRFDAHDRESFDDGWGSLDEEPPTLRTEVAIDATRKIITYNDSPDIPFDRTINPYRGCEHGCIYCYARPSHAYLGLSPGLDFESRLQAKPDAPDILRRELAKPGYRCAPIALGMNTDAYQPIEREYRITRGILEVLAETRHPVTMVTKSALVERDIDLLASMAAQRLTSIYVTITTLDRSIARRLEPRAAAPERRLETIRRLAEAGIPTGVMVAPVIPALTDHDMERILELAAAAGGSGAGYVLLRLPYEIAPLFEEWLQRHYPLKAEHVLSLIRQSRGGKAYDATFHTRMKGEGLFAELIARRFKLACERLGLNRSRNTLDCSLFTPPAPPSSSSQLPLF
ncbi:MAG: PA0069 family radical SAM protein [Methylophilaceae bacterium]